MSAESIFPTEILGIDVLQNPLNLAVETELAEHALRLAIYGLLDEAQRLVSLLNKYNLVYHSHQLQVLWFAWNETGRWPDGEFEKVHGSLEDIADEHLRSLRTGHKEDRDGLIGIDRLHRLLKDITEMNSTYKAATQKSRALVEALDLSLMLFPNDWREDNIPAERKTNLLSSVTESGGQVERCFTQAILISIGNRISNDQFSSLTQWENRTLSNDQVSFLTQSARAWKILKTGALAKASGIRTVELEQQAQIIEGIFQQRLTFGPQLDPHQTIFEILKTCSDNTRDGEGPNECREEAVEENIPETLLCDAASLNEITELESRLQVELPADFKEFLTISNGFGSSWNGYYMGVPLHSTKDIRWLRDDETYFLDLSLDLLEEDILYSVRDLAPELLEAWPTVSAAIEIGTMDIFSVWLLPPEVVNNVRKAYLRVFDSTALTEGSKKSISNAICSFCGSREEFEKLDWCVLTWACGGAASMIGYSSFKAFLVEKARSSKR